MRGAVARGAAVATGAGGTMAVAASRIDPVTPATWYDLLERMPEAVTCEIADGGFYAHPRPRFAHGNLVLSLGGALAAAFEQGWRGPGGWVFATEVELHFRYREEVLVPDLAGWRVERRPDPEEHQIRIVPDWVCEILSPSTLSYDREVKMPIYARYGVPYAWLVEPLERRIEAFRLSDGRWVPAGGSAAPAPVRLPPFEAVGLEGW